MPRLAAGEWLVLAGAVLLLGVGVVCIGVALGANIDAAETRQTWVESGAEQRAERVVAQPTPIWLPATPVSTSLMSSTPVSSSTLTFVPAPTAPALVPAPAPVARLSTISLLDGGFVFLDPPQPGAHARAWLRATSAGPDPASIALVFPMAWFDGYRIASTTPPAERATDGGKKVHLVFNNLPPGTTTLQVDVASTGEGIEAPVIDVQHPETGEPIGQARLQTVAPRPAPGPVSALRIPRLGLNVAVVPTTWEPPPFIVGEVKGSANIGQGNTVLVGHLTGAAGAVFKQLDDLAPGDPVVAVSRGLEYTFTVSDKQTLPADDSEPIAPDDRPHLTLMTCTGTWDPIAHNYSDRLWVTAEPPELAAATIAANSTRPPTPVPTSTGDLVDDSVDAGPMDSPAPSNVTGIGSVSVPGGLGAARSTFDAAYGPPVGETPSKLVVYRKGSVEYHVRFTPDPPRARVITLASTDGSGTLSPATAVERVQALFPPDARVLRLVGPESDAGVFVGRMASAELAKAMELRLGHFLVAYSRNAAGVITQAVAAVGDNLDAAMKESSN